MWYKIQRIRSFRHFSLYIAVAVHSDVTVYRYEGNRNCEFSVEKSQFETIIVSHYVQKQSSPSFSSVKRMQHKYLNKYPPIVDIWLGHL